jgi:hypothetical protein
MSYVTRRGLFGGIVLVAGTATLVPSAMAQLQAEVYVPIEPPPPRTEVIPVIPRERVEREYWQPGYWRWDGHEHVWVSGHYMVRPRPAAVWVPGRWERRPGGWLFIEGHWS